MATSKKSGGTIKRRTGGVGHSTGKGTSLKKINKERKDWYDSKMEGTAGPYNPPKKRYRKRPATGAAQDYPTKKTPKKASAMGFTKKDVAKSKKRRTKKTVKKQSGGMTHEGLYPAEEARAGVLSEKERRRFAKTGGTVKRKAGGMGLTKKDLPSKHKSTAPMGTTKKDLAQGKETAATARTKKTGKRILKPITHVLKKLGKNIRAENRSKGKNPYASRKAGGTVKKQTGGLTQGYDARLDESLGARHRGTTGNLAARRHESEGMERALGRRPYSAASTMAKKGGSVSRKKGGTTSRKGGGKIMVGYKAGGRV